MGEKKHINKIPPRIPGQSRENFFYVFFLYVFFFAPNKHDSAVIHYPGVFLVRLGPLGGQKRDVLAV